MDSYPIFRKNPLVCVSDFAARRRVMHYLPPSCIFKMWCVGMCCDNPACKFLHYSGPCVTAVDAFVSYSKSRIAMNLETLDLVNFHSLT